MVALYDTGHFMFGTGVKGPTDTVRYGIIILYRCHYPVVASTDFILIEASSTCMHENTEPSSIISSARIASTLHVFGMMSFVCGESYTDLKYDAPLTSLRRETLFQVHSSVDNWVSF